MLCRWAKAIGTISEALWTCDVVYCTCGPTEGEYLFHSLKSKRRPNYEYNTRKIVGLRNLSAKYGSNQERCGIVVQLKVADAE